MTTNRKQDVITVILQGMEPTFCDRRLIFFFREHWINLCKEDPSKIHENKVNVPSYKICAEKFELVCRDVFKDPLKILWCSVKFSPEVGEIWRQMVKHTSAAVDFGLGVPVIVECQPAN